MEPMSSLADIDAALEPLRESLRPDGADLAVEELGDAGVTVRLQLQPDACMECIVGADVLKGIITHQLESAGLPSTAVTLRDPRSVA